MRRMLLILVVGMVLLGHRAAFAQSLWERRNPYSAFLFVDTRAGTSAIC